MSYLTLTEAAQYVSEKAGQEIGPAWLLRAGVHGALLLCAMFSGPIRNLTTHRNDDVLGLLTIPPRHLAEIETDGQTKIIGAFSLDGKTAYSPQVTRTHDQLRVQVNELDRIILRIESTAPAESRGTRKKLTAAQEKEVRQRIEKGESVASLARLYGVSRPTIDKSRGAKKVMALQNVWGTKKPTRPVK